MTKPTKEELYEIIVKLSISQKFFAKMSEQVDDPDLGFKVCQMLEEYKSPLLYAWQKYGYGWHSDFWKEGDSMIFYDRFEISMRLNPKEIIDDMIKSWKFDSRDLQSLGNEGEKIFKGVSKVYEALKNDLK